MIDWSANIPRIKERSRTTRTLHMCCGKDKYAGAVGTDNNPVSDADLICNFNKFPYPFKDNEFETVICLNGIEHLRDIVNVMRELYRICKSGAIIFILTPHFSDAGSYIDPTHLHHFSARSFDYFIEGTKLFQKYGYYSECRFKLLCRHLMLHRRFVFLEGLVNRHIAFYEEILCYLIRGRGIYLELEVVK